MIRSRSCFVLAAVIQVIFGRQFGKVHRKPYYSYLKNIPRSCWNLPRHLDLDKCCPIPNLYSDEVMESCGFEKPPENSSGDPVRPKGPKTILPFCRDGLCLMANADLLRANYSVDYETLRNYIDQWAVANPDFYDTILEAKEMCADEEDKAMGIGLSSKVCVQDRIYVCLNTRLLWNCNPQPFKECEDLQFHMDRCRPYYNKPE